MRQPFGLQAAFLSFAQEVFSLFIFPKTEPRRFSEAIGNGNSEDVT